MAGDIFNVTEKLLIFVKVRTYRPDSNRWIHVFSELATSLWNTATLALFQMIFYISSNRSICARTPGIARFSPDRYQIGIITKLICAHVNFFEVAKKHRLFPQTKRCFPTETGNLDTSFHVLSCHAASPRHLQYDI